MSYRRQVEKAKRYAKKQKEKSEIEKIKHMYDKEKQPLSFGKAALLFIIINCTCIEVFSCVAMWHFADLSALTSLIVAVVGECVSTCCYFWKSTRENQANGITYELAMRGDENGT